MWVDCGKIYKKNQPNLPKNITQRLKIQQKITIRN